MKTVKKPVTKKVTAKKEKKGIEIITPKKMEVTEIKSEKVNMTVFPKFEILTKIPLPDGYIRSIVTKDYNGMTDELRAGDIIDLPERRFKSLSFRGLVAAYMGELQPNKNR